MSASSEFFCLKWRSHAPQARLLFCRALIYFGLNATQTYGTIILIN